jgi:hypothetical protein
MTAFACAGCHAAPIEAGGPIVVGLNNADLDLSGMILKAGGVDTGFSPWGEGRVDVTSDGIENPTAIPDIRATRHVTHLHRAATVRNGLVELAIRTETLIITGLGNQLRPPRKLAFALALYLWDLAPDVPKTRPESFEQACGNCHGSPGLSGSPVPIEEIDTDDRVARSPDRITGTWNVPSLLGTADRRNITASGAIQDLRHLMNPTRQVPGHLFGHELDEGKREEIIEFLTTASPPSTSDVDATRQSHPIN